MPAGFAQLNGAGSPDVFANRRWFTTGFLGFMCLIGLFGSCELHVSLTTSQVPKSPKIGANRPEMIDMIEPGVSSHEFWTPHGLLILSQGSLKAGKVADGFVFDEPWPSLAWAA